MKKYLFLILPSFAACDHSGPRQQAAMITNTEQAQSQLLQAGTITDPVCGMVKDSTWTEYTVYKGDTVWFCAAKEKTAFEGNPAKYEKNIIVH